MPEGTVSAREWSRGWLRGAAWFVFAAYLPSLLFLGHWELRIDIPGTNYYVGLPGTGHHHDHDHSDHSQHCHTDLASCSQVPLVTTAPVATLQAALQGATGETHGHLVPGSAWRPHGTEVVTPDPPPPRSA